MHLKLAESSYRHTDFWKAAVHLNTFRDSIVAAIPNKLCAMVSRPSLGHCLYNYIIYIYSLHIYMIHYKTVRIRILGGEPSSPKSSLRMATCPIRVTKCLATSVGVRLSRTQQKVSVVLAYGVISNGFPCKQIVVSLPKRVPNKPYKPRWCPQQQLRTTPKQSLELSSVGGAKTRHPTRTIDMLLHSGAFDVLRDPEKRSVYDASRFEMKSRLGLSHGATPQKWLVSL